MGGGRHAELRQVLHRSALVEQSEHGGLTPDGRAGGDAHVDACPVDLGLELAVLRPPPLDDVHVGHDLDSADEFRAGRIGQAEHLPQRPIDPVADADLALGGLDVDVRRPVAQGLGDDLVDQLDDRRLVRRADDGVDLLLGGVGLPELLDALVAVRQHAIVGVERRHHVVGRREVDVDVFDVEPGQRLTHGLARAVGDGDVEYAVGQAQRHDAEPAGHLFADEASASAVGRTVRRSTVGRPSCVARARVRARVEQPLLDQDGTQLAAGFHLEVERAGELFGEDRWSDSRTSPRRVRVAEDRWRHLPRHPRPLRPALAFLSVDSRPIAPHRAYRTHLN